MAYMQSLDGGDMLYQYHPFHKTSPCLVLHADNRDQAGKAAWPHTALFTLLSHVPFPDLNILFTNMHDRFLQASKDRDERANAAVCHLHG